MLSATLRSDRDHPRYQRKEARTPWWSDAVHCGYRHASCWNRDRRRSQPHVPWVAELPLVGKPIGTERLGHTLSDALPFFDRPVGQEGADSVQAVVVELALVSLQKLL